MEEKAAAAVRFEEKRDSGLDIAGGPLTESYEKYVRRMFSPIDQSSKTHYSDMVAELDVGNPLPDLPASVLLRMEQMEEQQTEQHKYSPLELMYDFYDKYGLEEKPYRKYPVYETKASSEYYSLMNQKPRVGDSPAVSYKVSSCKI